MLPFSINIRGRLKVYSSPIIMAIVNTSADSFYGQEVDTASVFRKIDDAVANGAAIIDIGGESTRPGSQAGDIEGELAGVLPAIAYCRTHHPTIVVSIDTYKAAVAAAALRAGADIVNDISAGSMDDGLLQVVAEASVPYICMHMQGTPPTMQLAPKYKDVVVELLDFFIQKIAALQAIGIKDIIIDPGFGFGKSVAHNYTILSQLSSFAFLNKPVLAGLSRKGMLYRPLGIQAADALPATVAANIVALQQGAAILRVHDVAAAAQTIGVYQQQLLTF